ncbi:MAG: substrate-binding domain-containing protein [Lachnospiraceae bacterium]
MKKIVVLLLCLIMVVSVIGITACSSDEPQQSPDANTDNQGGASTGDGTLYDAVIEAGKTYTLGTCVKAVGIGWFDRMNEGVKSFAEKTGSDAYLDGPPETDAAAQNNILNDMIANGCDALCVVPFSAEACEPVLKSAMDQDIVVIGHEADSFVNCDFDIEALDNSAYGAALMDALAEGMGEEGEYITTVGAVTSTSQVQWEEGGYNRQQEAYPNMKAVERKLETGDSQDTAKEIMAEMLKKYPDLKGFQGATSQDAPGAAQAVEEANLLGKVTVVGTSMPSIGGKFMESGSLSAMACWDPAAAGEAMNVLACTILNGNRDAIKVGANIGVEGYDNIQLNPNKADSETPEKYLQCDAMILITSAEDMANYPF